jgi:archaellin
VFLIVAGVVVLVLLGVGGFMMTRRRATVEDRE